MTKWRRSWHKLWHKNNYLRKLLVENPLSPNVRAASVAKVIVWRDIANVSATMLLVDLNVAAKRILHVRICLGQLTEMPEGTPLKKFWGGNLMLLSQKLTETTPIPLDPIVKTLTARRVIVNASREVSLATVNANVLIVKIPLVAIHQLINQMTSMKINK